MFRFPARFLRSLVRPVRHSQTRVVRKAARTRMRCSLCLEALEDRTLLSGMPQMLRNIGSGASNFTASGSQVFFTATGGLWKTDGTAAGTSVVSSLAPGGQSLGSRPLVDANGTLYFEAYDSTNTQGLWKSDGTPAGTQLVKYVNSYGAPVVFANLANVGSTLFFLSTDKAFGQELWKTDGTQAGTVLVKDINPGPADSQPDYLTNVNGTLFFTADDGVHGRELWKSDGSAAGTVMVSDISLGSGSSSPTNLSNVNGTLFFTASDGTGSGYELWRSDGTAAGTTLVKVIGPPSAGASPGNFTNVNGTLFFTGNDGTAGTELWKSDGTTAGTSIVQDINPGSAGSFPLNLVSLNGLLVFCANDGTHGWELWKSDGTLAGTNMVKDINPGSGSSCPTGQVFGGTLPKLNYATNVNGTLYFQATDGTSGLELWQSDGTAAGTVRVMDINPGSGDSSPSYLTNINGTLYFSANDGVHGGEPWILTTGPSLSVSAPATATAGAPLSITVTALDASNNVNPNYTSTIHFTSSDPLAILPADYTFTSADQGVHAFTVTLEKAGAQAITAIDTTTSTIGGSSSTTVTAAAASSLNATGFPSSTTAGNPGNIVVTAFDPYGNIATGYTGTVHFSSSDGKAALPAEYTFTLADGGSHAFSVTLKTAGPQSITAADTATSSMTSTQAGITVNPAAGNILVITGPSSVTHGVAFSITVTAYDAYGNVATGYTGTVHFKSSDGSARLPANYSFTAFDKGTHTFSGVVLKTRGKQTITAVDTLFSSITGTLTTNVV